MKIRRAALAAIVTATLSIAGLGTAGLVAGTTAGAAAASTTRVAVPWHQVGAGWVLTQYTTARPQGGSGPVTLYLISPGGTKYQLAYWPAGRTAPQLLAWSPDGKRALLQLFS